MYVKKFPILLAIAWFVIVAIIIGKSLSMSEWSLIYTIDDPYIHLAVAENILSGGYGINSGEYSTPSSSIIWPFLLALTEFSGLGSWGPLVLNLLAMGFAVYVAGIILQNHIFPHIFSETSLSSFEDIAFKMILGFLFCSLMSAWALVMTGMEHSLHILAVFVVFWKLLEAIEKKVENDPLLIIAIATLPIIRFEGFAMFLFTEIALLYIGQGKAAFKAAVLFSSFFITWLIFTKIIGQPFMPSSVMMKSIFLRDLKQNSELMQITDSILVNLLYSIENSQGIFLIIGILVLLFLDLKKPSEKNKKVRIVFLLLGTMTGLSHIFFGRYGGFYRYEVYAIVIVWFSVLILSRSHINLFPYKILISLTIFSVSIPYIVAAFLSPMASNGIYNQQYQMHRFATIFWKKPIAVNDIGWLSYRNQEFVLDLYGLASEEIRILKSNGQLNAKALAEVVRRHNVDLAMIYESWFIGIIPSSWKKVAVLKTESISADSNQVSFYLTNNTNNSESILFILNKFSKTLPPFSNLIIE